MGGITPRGYPDTRTVPDFYQGKQTMNKPVRAAKMPGEAAEQFKQSDQADDVVALSVAEYEALQARVRAAEQAAQAAVAATKRPDPNRTQAERLPDQSEIDISKHTRPVLTKQGWVVPTEYGKAPAGARV